MSETTVRRPINWSCSAESNVGMVRKINEDSILMNADAGLWAVADGMGGYEAGDVASNMIVSSLSEIKKHEYLYSFVDDVEDKLIDTNNRILEYSEIMHDGRMLGSTIISLLIQGQVGVCVWVGDSRLYRIRNNELQQVSRDHSHVQELIDQGLITPEEAEHHPEGNIITRAVGTGSDLYVDISAFNIQLGDKYLLCSDGLYNAVSEYEILQCIIDNDDDLDVTVNKLIQLALDYGAPDNVSVIFVKSSATRHETH
jgi:serine/threonine protein phosphatase PrpC